MRRTYTVSELIGKTFHWLTLLEPVRKEVSGRVLMYWTCRCKCGNETTKREQNIITHRTRSCGCLHQHKPTGKRCSKWRGYEEISGYYLNNMRENARRRGHECTVTPEYLWKLFLAQNKACALTGLPITFRTRDVRRKHPGEDQTASLDRKDSSLGYVPGNVWWVHKDVNKMKNVFELSYFKKLCRLITELDS